MAIQNRIEPAEVRRAESAGRLQEAEGLVDPGDALRARIHYLVAQHQSLIAQTQFADAKAAALMTLVGVIALRGPLGDAKFSVWPLGLLVGGLLAAAIVSCLWAIIPRYPRATPFAQRKGVRAFAWTSLASDGWGEERYAEFVRDGAFAELMQALAESNLGALRVLAKKFRAMWFASICAILGVLVVVAVFAYDYLAR